MKKTLRFLGITAIAAIIGFGFASCEVPQAGLDGSPGRNAVAGENLVLGGAAFDANLGRYVLSLGSFELDYEDLDEVGRTITVRNAGDVFMYVTVEVAGDYFDYEVVNYAWQNFTPLATRDERFDLAPGASFEIRIFPYEGLLNHQEDGHVGTHFDIIRINGTYGRGTFERTIRVGLTLECEDDLHLVVDKLHGLYNRANTAAVLTALRGSVGASINHHIGTYPNAADAWDARPRTMNDLLALQYLIEPGVDPGNREAGNQSAFFMALRAAGAFIRLCDDGDAYIYLTPALLPGTGFQFSFDDAMGAAETALASGHFSDAIIPSIWYDTGTAVGQRDAAIIELASALITPYAVRVALRAAFDDIREQIWAYTAP